MPDDNQKSQAGKDVGPQNIEDEDILEVNVEDEGAELDEDVDDEELEVEGFEDFEPDDGRAGNVSADEDPVEREIRLGNRITRDDGDNDDLGELK